MGGRVSDSVEYIIGAISRHHVAGASITTKGKRTELCESCAESWPCSARIVLDRIDALTAERDELRSLLGDRSPLFQDYEDVKAERDAALAALEAYVSDRDARKEMAQRDVTNAFKAATDYRRERDAALARIAALEQERDHVRLELLNQEEAARVRTNLQIATFKRLVGEKKALTVERDAALARADADRAVIARLIKVGGEAAQALDIARKNAGQPDPHFFVEDVTRNARDKIRAALAAAAPGEGEA